MWQAASVLCPTCGKQQRGLPRHLWEEILYMQLPKMWEEAEAVQCPIVGRDKGIGCPVLVVGRGNGSNCPICWKRQKQLA
jgi:hypothetical protein